MPGFFPAPAKVRPGLIGWEGQPLLPVDPVTGLTIVPGSGLIGREIGGKLYLDSQHIDYPETFSIFVPGAIAAGTIGVWRNGRASGRASALSLEANFGTAQTTEDAANYYALQAADVLGTKTTVPFTAAKRHFSLESGDGVAIAQPYAATAITNSMSSFATNGIAQQFTTTADLTITGFRFFGCVQTNNPSGTFVTSEMRCQILDGSDFSVLGETTATMTAQAQQLDFAFPLSIPLSNGKTYWVAVDDYSQQSAGWNPYALQIGIMSGSGAAQSAPITVGTTAHTSLSNPPAPATPWADILAPGSSLNTGPVASGLFAAASNGNALLGTAGSTVFSGDVTLSIVTVGAPASTAAGSDLNARVQLGAAG